MAHSANIISKIKLPSGETYEIHDPHAIHSAEELGLSAALNFKGTVSNYNELPMEGNKVGDVWHVTATDFEYVWTDVGVWEELGAPHNFASNTHTHAVTVGGVNAPSSVTGKVVVPTISATQKHLTASVSVPDIHISQIDVLGADASVNVAPYYATLSATASGATVGADGTAAAITGFGNHTTASAITALNTATIKNPTSISKVDIPNVTGNTTVSASKVSATTGTKASWSAAVSSDGVLSFSWAANTPTAVTVSDVSASKVTLGTPLSASNVSTTDVSVATGAKTTAAAITALGTPTKSTVLTGVKVTSQPTVRLKSDPTELTGDVTVMTGIREAALSGMSERVVSVVEVETVARNVTLAENATAVTGSAPVVSEVVVSTTSAQITEGVAAAQTWTQGAGTTGTPIE